MKKYPFKKIIIITLYLILLIFSGTLAYAGNDQGGTYVYTPPDSGEKGDSVIDDDDKNADKEVDNNAVMDEDDSSSKEDKDAVIDDDSD